MKTLRAVVTSALLSSLVVSSAWAKPYTLPELMEEVEKTHPLMGAARAGLEQLEAKLSQAQWAIFPTFQMQGSATLTPHVEGNALEHAWTWDKVGVYGQIKLDMTQPLWTFGKISSLKRAGAAGVQVGQAAVDTARWELRLRAAEAYLGRLLSKELEGMLSEGEKWITKAEERMERLRDEDSAEYDQIEHLRLKTQVSEFWQLAYENKNLQLQTQEGLRILLSEKPGTDIELSETDLTPYEVQLLNPEVYVALMEASDPGLRVARSTAKAQRALADAKTAELYPDFALVGQLGIARANQIEDQHSPFANDPYNSRTAVAALVMRWKLDVPQRVLQADEAKAKARQVEAEAEVRADLQELRVRQLVQDLSSKRELLKIYAQSQRAAQGWLTATWDTYDAGFGNFKDVMDALVQFYQKKFSYLKLILDHNVACWKLSQAVGVDIRTLSAETK